MPDRICAHLLVGGPYGVEAVMRDNTGNWLVLAEPRPFTPADFT